METASPRIWIITSGRRGDIVQCRAVAERLSSRNAEGGGNAQKAAIAEKVVAPRAMFSLLMPFGPIDPAEADLIAPPYPDIVIASGRRAVPYVRAIVKASKQGAGPACRAIFMKYPGCTVRDFALLWTPAHDRREAPGIITTLTGPHLASAARLAAHRDHPHPGISALPAPRLGILLGGNTRHVTYDRATIRAFCDRLAGNLAFGSFLVTGSRRTPPEFIEAIRKTLAPRPVFMAEDAPDNPYFDILANADALFVTGDSHNLVSEALAAGCPVHVFRPPGNPAKFAFTLAKLEERGWIEPDAAALIPGACLPHDATDEIVEALRRHWALNA